MSIGPAARTGNKFNSKPSMSEKKTDAINEAKDSHPLRAAKNGPPRNQKSGAIQNHAEKPCHPHTLKARHQASPYFLVISPQVKFAVQLTGTRPLLEHVAPCFQGEFARIVKVGDDWFLESSAFSICAAPAEVYPIADQILKLIHRVTAVYARLFSPFEIGYVQAFSDDGTPVNRALRAMQRVQVYSGEGIAELQALREEQSLGTCVVHEAMADEELLAALALVGDQHEIQWPQLYDILEFLGGERVIAGKNWATRAQVRRCRQTANYYRHLGRPIKNPLPANPLSLGEATAMVLGLLKNWIAEQL